MKFRHVDILVLFLLTELDLFFDIVCRQIVKVWTGPFKRAKIRSLPQGNAIAVFLQFGTHEAKSFTIHETTYNIFLS